MENRRQTARGVIFWDFDGTLATRRGMWSGALLEALDERLPGHGITLEQIRPHMRDGFPWNRPEVPHPELSDATTWWAAVSRVYTRALQALGVAEAADDVADVARQRFVDPANGWFAFEDSAATLTLARARGWSNHVLSNHVPELPQIVRHLGLAHLIDGLHNSAVSGYEKPHPRAFELALDSAAVDPGDAWMVGDNPVADIAGAHRAGLRAVLVSRAAEASHTSAAPAAPTLAEALRLVEAHDAGPT